MMPCDVTPEQMRFHDELIRRASPSQRTAALDSICAGVRELAAIGIKHRHPEASAELHRWMLAELIYGREVAERIVGPRPAR